MKNLLPVVLLSIIVLFSNCNDDDQLPNDFALKSNSSILLQGYVDNIEIISGSGDYTFTMDNPDIVKAEHRSLDKGYGYIVISPINIGDCIVTVTDNKLKKSKEIAVSSVYSGFALGIDKVNGYVVHIDNEEDKKKITDDLEKKQTDDYLGNIMVVVMNKACDFYLFENIDSLKKGDYITSGYYSLDVENYNISTETPLKDYNNLPSIIQLNLPINGHTMLLEGWETLC